jgi:hypothetical protein
MSLLHPEGQTCRDGIFSDRGLPEMPILGNLEALGGRRGPRLLDLGPLFTLKTWWTGS